MSNNGYGPPRPSRINPMAFGPGPGTPGPRSVPARGGYSGTDPGMASSGPRMGPRGGPPAHAPGYIHTMADIRSSRAQGPPGGSRGMMGPPGGMIGPPGPRMSAAGGPRMSAAQGNMQGEGRRISSALPQGPRQSAPFGGFGEDDFAKVGRGPAGGGHGFVEPTRSSRAAQSASDAPGGEMEPQGYGGGGREQGYGGEGYGGGGYGSEPMYGGRGPRPIPGDPSWLFNRRPYQRSQAFLRFQDAYNQYANGPNDR